jgi:hypothetical protein
MWPFWIIGIILIISGVSVMWSWDIIIGLLVIVSGIATIIVYYFSAPKYPVTAYIFQRREGGYKLDVDKVGRFRTGHKEDTYEYRFRKIKDTCPAARYDNIFPTKRGEIAFFFSPAPGEYLGMTVKEFWKKVKSKVPDPDNPGYLKEIETDDWEPTIQPIDDDLHSWFVQKAKRMKQKYENISSWDKYYPIIVIIIVAVALVIVFNAVLGGVNKTAAAFQEAANTNKEAIATMSKTLERVANILEEKQEIPSGIPLPPDVG